MVALAFRMKALVMLSPVSACTVALEAKVSDPVPKAYLLLTDNVPALRNVPPVKLLDAERMVVPVPNWVTEPFPVITLESEYVPERSITSDPPLVRMTVPVPRVPLFPLVPTCRVELVTRVAV